MNNTALHPASFKDPAGFVFFYEGKIYRQINRQGADDFELLISSGLYDKLSKQKKIDPHNEIADIKAEDTHWYKTILPEQIPFISYPYEWSFEQLKDAALLTLQVQKEALQHGMCLKDATPFNIQWLNGKAVFIDTLSFEKYKDGEPWAAYKQFCENFLAPLLLMRHKSSDLNKLLVSFPSGISIPLTASLLPFKTKFNMGIYLHIHLQAKMQKNYQADKPQQKTSLSLHQLNNILSSLENLVKKLSHSSAGTKWNNYYEETILSNDYLKQKQQMVLGLLSGIGFNTVADLGANKGEFSLLLKDKADKIIAADFDEACINELYIHLKENKIKNIYPVVVDVSNPSPAIGWANTERNSFWNRTNVDVMMALALVHHLAISFNIGFEMMAELFSKKCKYLLIEFVPKKDPKVQQLLRYRKDVFENYTQEGFEKGFSNYFTIETKQPTHHSTRILYLMKTRHTHA